MVVPFWSAIRRIIWRNEDLSGVELIAQEQLSQVREHGWSAAHDDEHQDAELSRTGAVYATTAAIQIRIGGTGHDFRFGVGEFPNEWFKEGAWQPSDDPEGNLVVAGALIARELDLVRRQKAGSSVPQKREPRRVAAAQIATGRPAKIETGVEHGCADKGAR